MLEIETDRRPRWSASESERERIRERLARLCGGARTADDSDSPDDRS